RQCLRGLRDLRRLQGAPAVAGHRRRRRALLHRLRRRPRRLHLHPLRERGLEPLPRGLRPLRSLRPAHRPTRRRHRAGPSRAGGLLRPDRGDGPAKRGILWLSKPHVPPILHALAHGEVPLTHDGLSSLSPPKSVAHIRDLLIAAGVLPPADRHLVLFEQWLARWLEQLSDPAQHKILQTYATWSVLRRLRKIVEDGPLGPY